MKKKESKKVPTLLIRNVPEDTKRRFKAYCAQQGVSLGNGLVMIIEDAIKHNRIPAQVE